MMEIAQTNIIAFVSILLAFAAVIYFLAFINGSSVGKKRMEEEAIKKGFAEYNKTTGVWEWKK